MTLLAATAALLCVACNDSGTDTQSPRWGGDVDRFLRMGGDVPHAVVPPAVEVYSVRYDGNGNTGGEVPVDGGSYQSGAEVVVRAPGDDLVKTGYNFSDWNTRSDGEGTSYGLGSSFHIYGDTRLYARWTPAAYTVTVAGGTGSDDYEVGTRVAITAAEPAAGWRFQSWTVTGGSAVLANENSPTTTFTMPSNAVSVTANLELIIYTITYYLDSGSVSTANPTNYTVESGEITLNNPAKAGYTFTGWTGSNGETPQTTVNIEKWSTGDRSYTANFKQNMSVETFVDDRNGKTYKKVKIGSQTWMAENLNYEPSSGNSWCYDNKDSYCNQYGRLYDWSTANNVCPSGWHLPSRVEWTTLVNYAGGSSTAGKKLKATNGWGGSSYNGTDDYYFSALPGGYRFSNVINAHFSNAGNDGYWWTATYYDDKDAAYCRNLHYNGGDVSDCGSSDFLGYSVRCLQD
jgi:uncharacterized protein (TIGR02145 family)/uncharacterized repeat protein (TIGR02543 family)